MMLSRKTQIFAAILLATSLAACTTTKKVEDDAAAQAATQAAADKAAAERAAAAAETAKANAASTSNDLSSQALADAQSAAAQKANDIAGQLGIKTFNFAYDSNTIADKDYPALKAHAFYLSKNPSARVRVEGNTDERGTREYNMALGERRAKAVAVFLTSNGAKANQLDVISYGEEKPVASGESEEAWAQNRRVDLDYTAGKP